MDVRQHTVHVTDRQLRDLQERLARVRLPGALDPAGWGDGAALSFVEALVARWSDRFDWRAAERRLNALPNRIAEVGGQDIHFVHVAGVGAAPAPIVLTHGWPGSFVEFERLIPLLADPGAHGADPADAFHVVVPSLPGYGLSPAPTAPGMGSRAIATLWRDLMAGLGHGRFFAQGGDIGAGVSLWLAREHPDNVVGAHLNYVSPSVRPWLGEGSRPASAGERAYLYEAARFAAEEGAYAALQATKPQTLAFALSDSPAGLAAWMAEKFVAWSDHDGDVGAAIPIDAMLTNIALHWFSGGLAASLRLYKENRSEPLAFGPGDRIGPPLGVARFPRELPMPPRSWVERFATVTRWTEMPAGGHFAALERPGLLAADIRAFCRPLRSALG